MGASRGAELQPCFVRCALPSTSGAARGSGSEASVLAFPTPDPGLLRLLAEAQARSGCWEGVGAVAGAVTTAALEGNREKLGMRGPHLLLGRGSPSLCTALPKAEEGSWLGEGAINIYK